MKRWLASLFFFAACSPQPSSIPTAAPPAALASAIPEGSTVGERRALYAAAMEAYASGDLPTAQSLFERVADVYPELADYARRYLALIAESRGDSAAALSSWKRLLAIAPDSVWQGEAALALGRQSARDGNWADAARELATAREHLREPGELASAFALSSEAAARLGDLQRSRMLTTELRTRYPSSPEAAAARERAWANRETVALADAKAASEEASLLLSEGEARRALELVRLAEEHFHSDRDRPLLLWLEADALDRSGDRDAAERLLERVHERYRRHPLGARALFRLASLAWNRDDDARALARFERYLREYPRGARAAEALYAVGRIHQEAGRYEAAIRSFSHLAQAFPKSPLAGEARFRVGWCHYRAGERAAAARSFRDLAGRSAAQRPAALYWEARAADDAGGYERLLEEFPDSYYAALAERRLGKSPGSALAGRLPSAPAVAADTFCDAANPHLARFRELKALELFSFARTELAALQGETSACDRFLIAAWVEVDGYRQSVSRALRTDGCDLESRWFRFCFPLGYWPSIERETAGRGLDPYLIAGLIRQESLFDPEARSAANALGLMQLLPKTGEREAAELGFGGFHTALLLEPSENLRLGTRYLRGLLDRYRGDLPRALAAYNAGEAAVDKWNERYGSLDDDEFVESISYRETRGYVKRVLENRRIYHALYGSPPAVSIDSLSTIRPGAPQAPD